LRWLTAIMLGSLFFTTTRAFSVRPSTSSRRTALIPQTSRTVTPSLPLSLSFVRHRPTPPSLWAKEDDDDIVEETLFADGDEEEEEEEEWEEEDYEENEDEDWDDDEDFQVYELEEDATDPNYMKQKELMEASLKARQQVQRDETFDALDYIMNSMTDEEIERMEALPMQQEVEARVKGMELTEEDLNGMDMKEIEEKVEETDDILEDPAYPIYQEGEENILKEDIGITNDDMVDLENAWKIAQTAQDTPPWDKVLAKDEDPMAWAMLSNETLEEMDACLEEIGGSSYNVTRFLLYDLDFNVTNLMLAAVQHNRKAPILFQHWYPQLLTYKRYKNAADRNFDFTWQDVENADISELEDYYKGMGYDEIPTKAPGETGIISLEDLDEEEIRMAALENWIKDVYNPEWDRKDFDDDDMRDEDNVFSDYYEAPQHPDLPTYEDAQDDLEEWDEEMGDDDEDREHKKYMGRDYKYEVIIDEDFEREFRGHLVVCCTGDDSDLEIAEKITKRMEEEHGKQVFVETRVIAHAREEDNVFEVWLESYEVDLLHSKRRASMNVKDWDGPAECDDKEIEHLVNEVGFLISDDSRYSYRYDFEMVE